MSSTNNSAGKLALVTGASGFIGKHLCNSLLAKGYSVRAMLRDESDATGLPQDVEVCRASLADQDGLNAACSEVALIFHLAGIAHVHTPSSSQLEQTNSEGTRNLLAAGREAHVGRFILFSSILAAKPENHYAKSKQLAERAVLEQAGHYQSVTILRPVNVYGPGMKGNIAGLIKRIKSGWLPPFPRLHNHLSLVSVQDLCEAAILAAESPAAASQIYPVTDGKDYTPNTLESSIYAALGRKKRGWHCYRVVFYAASLGAQILNSLGIWNNDLGLRTYRNLVQNSVASCEKISTELGYMPTHTFSEELPAIISALE